MSKITSPDIMKISNKKKILEIIHREKNIYRAQIAEITNMSNQTVTNLVKELIQEGLVQEVSMEKKSRGRNPMALSINYTHLYAIGAEISVKTIRVGVYDFDGNKVDSVEKNYSVGENLLSLLKDILDSIISIPQYGDKIKGIALSIEGIVDDRKGLVIKAKDLGLDNVNIVNELGYTDIPVLIKNDVNMLAETFTRKDEMSNYMVIKLDRGIGAALVLNKNLLTSTNNVAGEFGHLKLYSIDNPKICKCGKCGCLTTEASLSAIEKKLEMELKDIIENYNNKDSNVYEVLEESAEFIAEPLANSIDLLDLDKVILTGKTVQYFSETVVSTIEKTLEGNINKWQSFKGIEVMEPFDMKDKCAKFVVENYFFGGKEELYD